MSYITLTEEQTNAFAKIKQFLADDERKSLTLDGPAGSGKTSLLRELSETLPNNVVICAPTNKATAVLRSKGFKQATTLDRVLNKSMYTPIQRKPTEEEIAFYTENEMVIPPFIEEEQYEKMPADSSDKVVCLDESSMTSADECARLVGMFNKTLLVGDSFQLPPVEGVPWFQTATHDVRLTQIMRTGEGSEITAMANMIRRQQPAWKTHNWTKEVTIISKRDQHATKQAMQQADQVLAFKNDTCDSNNFDVRELLGLVKAEDCHMPQRGDKLLAWETIKDTGVYKSELYSVLKAFRLNGGYRVLLDNTRGKYIDISKANLEHQKTEITVEHLHKFSYGFVITAHKSQGSEWPRVVVLAHDRSMRHEGYWNWLYTACTRAKQHLTVIV